MIEKLKDYSRSDIIQKLHEVIDVLNAHIEPPEPVMDESPRTDSEIEDLPTNTAIERMARMDESPQIDNEIGSRFHRRHWGWTIECRSWQQRVGAVNRRTTKDGDYYIGRRWGPHERRQTDRRKSLEPLRERLAEVLYEAGVNGAKLDLTDGGAWSTFRFKLADAIIKELRL